MKVTMQQLVTGQKVFRDKKGNFVSVKKVNRKSSPIRAGSLYEYKGTIVRAQEQYEKGQRAVSIHKSLFGLVKEKDLMPITKRTVNKYLSHS